MDVLTLENITMLVGYLLLFLFLVVCGCVLHANRTHVAYILAPMIDLLRRAAYVERGQGEVNSQTGIQYRHPPDIDAEIPAGVNALHTGTIPDETALIQHLSRLIKPSGVYWLSANKLYAAIGGDRETVLAVIRDVRGETVKPNDPYQFEPVNGNVNMSRRTGVKPLR